ncbi:MAG TPA: type I-E CRISPR-associated protein Cse2/CasB [Anaerolineaceae bacterium]|nr:type I-E CRISPR-associated protein Cse2/CasB [Anaerolineaceae bacterium]
MTEAGIHPFIQYLQSLAEAQDRGALSALRRGLGRPPGTVPEMYRYVEPRLAQKRSAAQESASYLIASLFAFHPLSTSKGNLGAHLASTLSPGGKDALERRFTALLAAHPDDLADALRQAISFLKSKDVPVNWNQLYWDVQRWDNEDRQVQKEWARAFWGQSQFNKESVDA